MAVTTLALRPMSEGDLDDVLALWSGLGYYSRARNLHRAARLVVADHQGVLPADRSAIQKLPGIGDYIAAAVLSIAFNQPYPVVDGNVKRVLARLFEMDLPVNQAAAFKQFYAKSAQLLDPRRPGDFNQAMMELGALVCRPGKPDCGHCPLRTFCRSYRHHTTDTYPRRLASKKIPHRHQIIAVISGMILIEDGTEKRPLYRRMAALIPGGKPHRATTLQEDGSVLCQSLFINPALILWSDERIHLFETSELCQALLKKMNIPDSQAGDSSA